MKLGTLTVAAPTVESSTYIILRIEGLTGDVLSAKVALKQGSTEILPVYNVLG